MRRGTVFIILFVVAAVAIVAGSQFLRTQPPLEIRVAVSPLAQAWVNDAVTAFNATNPLVNSTRRVHYMVEAIDDTQIWLSETRRWTVDNHPQGWMPAASFSVQLAAENRIPFVSSQASVAQTLLVWGGFNSYIQDIEADSGTPFDWAGVADAAPQRRYAFNLPTQTISGLSVLLSGAASYYSAPTLTGGNVNDAEFRSWIQPVLESVPNFNTLGTSVAQTLASRGSSIGEIGLVAESDWLQNLRGSLVQTSDPISLRYPQYTIVFDFPLVRWQDTSAPNGVDEAAAIDALGRWLITPEQQLNAQRFGLRPASGEPTADLFLNAQTYGAVLSPAFEAVQPPSLNDIRRMVDWVSNIVR